MEALALHLPSRGFEVVFALAKGKKYHHPDAFRAAFPMMHGVDVDGRSGTSYGRQRALRRAILDVDPDIILIARLFDVYPVASALKLEGHRLRLAVTVQSYEEVYFADLERYQDFVDVCVTSGEQIRAEVRRRTSVPAVSVPGGVAAPQRWREPHAGPLRIGYVGRVQQVQKRVLDLVPFVAELDRRGIPYTLDVAGDGPELAALRAQLPHARMHGWLSTNGLYERVYPELDVFVHFAEFEGMTIAPREAMAHGVVPVMSQNVGSEDFHHEVNALTFPVGDVQAAVDAVERLHRDRALLERLSSAARGSQGGIRSEQGAIDAWASALHEALARASRLGRTLPIEPRDGGFLTRIGAPEWFAELVRRVRRREHGNPGSEWPHGRG